MNKCLQCVNMQKKRNAHGFYTLRCSQHSDVIVYGELGTEPIVEDCWAFRKLRVYRKDGIK